MSFNGFQVAPNAPGAQISRPLFIEFVHFIHPKMPGEETRVVPGLDAIEAVKRDVFECFGSESVRLYNILETYGYRIFFRAQSRARISRLTTSYRLKQERTIFRRTQNMARSFWLPCNVFMFVPCSTTLF